MAEMTIQLRCDPATGKKDIVVSLRSDPDALSHEHDQLHRRLVEKLVQGGLIQPEEIGQIVIERESSVGETAKKPADETRQPAPALKQGG